MMPFMMGYMMKGEADKNMDAGMDSAVGELMHEGAAGLATNKGPYEQILVRKTEVSEDFMSSEKFKQTLLDVMYSENGWKILEKGNVLASNSSRDGIAEFDSERPLAALVITTPTSP